MSTLNDLGSISSNLRDRDHATKIFVDGNYELAPKYNFLYYVHIESTVYDKSKNIGMLVKSAQLPRFNVELRKSNLYNKTSWTQTKINYESVNIVFHDDNADTVRDFWREYFKYYYLDTNNPETTFDAMLKNKYSESRTSNDWGYTAKQNEPFIKKITIYSLHQKKFSSYSLMNPVIKSFQHGEHQYGASSEGMQNSMTVEYESVLYSQGKVVEDQIPGFLDLRYDVHPSPLIPAGGGTASIAGQGGLLETINQVGDDIQQGNFGAALFKGIQGVRNASNIDLKNAAVGELLDIGKNILRGNNGTKNIFIPTISGVSDRIGDLLNFGGSQGVNSKPNWLVSASNIGAMARTGFTRINQEVTDATARITNLIPKGITNGLPGIGSLLSVSPLIETLSVTELQSTPLLAQTASTLATESQPTPLLEQTASAAGIESQSISPLLRTVSTSGTESHPTPLLRTASTLAAELQPTPLLSRSVSVSSPEFVPDTSQLNQVPDIKLSSNQVSINDAQTKSTLRYNLNVAQQNKTQLLIEINSLKEQQQIAQDTIVTLISKRNNLLEEYEEFRNMPLINQLKLLIAQQEEFIEKNLLTINDKNLLVTQINKQIDFFNLKLSGTV